MDIRGTEMLSLTIGNVKFNEDIFEVFIEDKLACLDGYFSRFLDRIST